MVQVLGEFEQLVLLAVLQLDAQAYGMEVRRTLGARARREVAIGAVYATLDRLEAKGLLRSREVAPEAGARPRRVFEVSAEGRRALRATHAALRRMTADLPPEFRLS
jgi:DNA-binding PadR family transcriptional regulator